MIRVLHAIDTTGPGGAETVFLNLIKGLDPLRFKSFVVITGPGWVCDELRKNGIEPIFVQSRGGFNLQYLWALVRVIRKYKINLVQSHLLGSNLYCSLAGLICRTPVVSTFHGFVDSSAKDRLMPIKARLINRGSSRIVFVSDRLKENFSRKYGFSLKKSVTIYNGVDTSVFQPAKDVSLRKELGLGPENVLIGAVGNIRPAKGYECLIKAARLVCDTYPECKFVIAGEGSGTLYEELLNLRKRLNLEGSVFFLGFREDTAKVLNNLDVFVLPSVSEGFSIATIEAMACGLPVVATCSGGPEEIISNGETGLLVEVGSSEQTALAIEGLFRDWPAAKILAAAGRRFATGHFSVQAMVFGYQALYRERLCMATGHGYV